jgi:hypothetical protein
MVERSLRRGEGRGIGMAAYMQSPPCHPCIPYNSGPVHTCSCMNNFWSNINWCIRSGRLSCSREKGASSVPGGVGLFRLLLVAPTTCRSILPSSSGVGPFRYSLWPRRPAGAYFRLVQGVRVQARWEVQSSHAHLTHKVEHEHNALTSEIT